MKITSPKLKQLIFDLVAFSDEVDENGQTLPRKTFKKDLYRATVNLTKKLEESAEFAVDAAGVYKKAQEEGRKTLTPEEAATIVFKAKKDIEEGQSIFVGSIRFTEAEMDVTDEDKTAITTYWKECREIKDVGVETLDEFEALIA